MAIFPSWGGLRIAKVDERAMLVSELRMLKNHIFAHLRTWRSQVTGARLQMEKVNMYDVAYNWVCPLTLPEGVYLQGLDINEQD
eukprot:4105801-Amphidinium_carterae.1